jgi:pimeloyl-ACP methyl ester carboxylesterase
MACDICSELLMPGSDALFHVTAAERRLRARWFGAPDARAIVLLHQGLGSITQWRDFPPRLAGATGLPVLAYDRYGHGGSEGLDAPRSVDFLECEARVALPELLAASAITEPVLYGHSDGGTIALLFAAVFPAHPRAVISEAAHVFHEAHTAAGIAAVVDEFERGGLRRCESIGSAESRHESYQALATLRSSEKSINSQILRARLARHHGANTESMFYGWSRIWQSEAMAAWRITDRLPAIRAPLLVIQGADDEHGTRAQVEAIATGVSGPVETLLIPACRHSPHLEASETVLSRVAAFLRRALSDG